MQDTRDLGAANPKAPETLGKYPLLGLIGRGAMGVVYKSFDPHIRRPVALKTIRRDLLEEDGSGTFAARFRNEAQAAGRLLHPGIVAVYEYGEERGYAFIAMEYIEGSSLRHYFEKKVRFGVEDSVSIVYQLLEALQFAHERGVWHRDIKPANILVMSDGRVKVADFGIARIDSSTLTQIGAIMGTPGYIAPELYLSRESDCRIDVFAAGVVLYQLLVGAPPFTGPAESVMYRVCHETPTPPSVAASDPALSPFDAVVLKAMAKKPQDRYASAALFKDALLGANAAPVNAAVSEETIIREAPAPPDGNEARYASRGAGTPASTARSTASQAASTRTLAAAGWDLEMLGRIEKHLARFVGPMARVLVRRTAAASDDAPMLVQRLAEQLDSAEERTDFLMKTAGMDMARTLPPPGQGPADDDSTRMAPSGGVAVAAAVRLPTKEEMRLAAQLLAVHMGPIANTLVKRAAQPGVSREQFITALAGYLTDAQERARFLSRLG